MQGVTDYLHSIMKRGLPEQGVNPFVHVAAADMDWEGEVFHDARSDMTGQLPADSGELPTFPTLTEC